MFDPTDYTVLTLNECIHLMTFLIIGNNLLPLLNCSISFVWFRNLLMLSVTFKRTKFFIE